MPPLQPVTVFERYHEGGVSLLCIPSTHLFPSRIHTTRSPRPPRIRRLGKDKLCQYKLPGECLGNRGRAKAWLGPPIWCDGYLGLVIGYVFDEAQRLEWMEPTLCLCYFMWGFYSMADGQPLPAGWRWGRSRWAARLVSDARDRVIVCPL